MRDRLHDARRTLQLDSIANLMRADTAQLSTTLNNYMGAVAGIFSHMDKIAHRAVLDSEKVQLKALNLKYGLPENKVIPEKNTYPTIPSSYITNCSFGSRYLYNLPLDQQSMMIACALVVARASRSKIPPPHGKAVNSGLLFGDSGFKPLGSFRTL